MADKSRIEWTDATWNPVVGCSLVSPGCTNCYAMRQAARIEAMHLGAHLKAGQSTPFPPSPYAGTTQETKGGRVWTGAVAIVDDHALAKPLRWARPRRIFVNSMGDLFHERVPDAWIDRVFAVMALAPQHTFQVLTKRSARMRARLSEKSFAGKVAHAVLDLKRESGDRKKAADFDMAVARLHFGEPLPNVCLGVSAEDQRRADERVPDLLATPAAVRFVSAEPLLGPIEFHNLPFANRNAPGRQHALTGESIWPDGDYDSDGPRLDWIIVGGESGPDARPMSRLWAREIRDACAAARIAFFFKQWGEWAPARVRCSGYPGRFAFGDYGHDRTLMIEVDAYPRAFTRFGARSLLERVGKARAGRRLDGVEHNAFPEVSDDP